MLVIVSCGHKQHGFVYLIALRERLVPFLCQIQFFHISATLIVLFRAFRQTEKAEESGS